jgi:hypothetical protein
MLFAKIHPPTRVLLPEAFNAKTVSSPVPLASEPVLRYVAGSTVKVEQPVGEEDKQLHQLTLSRTATRYGIEGTDLGNSAYLSVVPAAQFESGKGTRYFAGLDRVSAPIWSEKESDARAVVQNGTMGDLSVTWCKDLGLWLMTYDSREPAPRGILFSYSQTPWGPWSDPQIIFNAARDGALGKFIHNSQASPDDGLSGPAIGKGQTNPQAAHGGAYAPYVIERWTRVKGSELSIYYAMSTWTPYVVVLMKSQLYVQ